MIPIEIIDAGNILRQYDSAFFELFKGRVRSLELTEGCSEQCPFCYLGVDRLSASFDSNSLIGELRNNKLFRDLFRKNARIGYKSEPLDNGGVIDISEIFLSFGFGLDLITAVSKLNPYLLLDALKLAKKYDWRIGGYAYPVVGLNLQISVTPKNYRRICDVLGIQENIDPLEAVSRIYEFTSSEKVGASVFIRDRISDFGFHPVGKGFDLVRFKRKYKIFENESETEWLSRVSQFLNYNAKGKLIFTPRGFYAIDTCILDRSNKYTGRELVAITNENYRGIYEKFIGFDRDGGDL